jgi:hypothetical protein
VFLILKNGTYGALRWFAEVLTPAERFNACVASTG